jgi:hypothetical protein
MNCIKHVNCRDVAFLPSKWTPKEDGGYEVSGLWINVVQKPFIIEQDTIFISASQVENWLPVTY